MWSSTGQNVEQYWSQKQAPQREAIKPTFQTKTQHIAVTVLAFRIEQPILRKRVS